MFFVRRLKHELFNIRKAFLDFGIGWEYLYYKNIISRRVDYFKEPIERPVTCGDFSMHVLFGHRYVHMALWSLFSFYSTSSCIGLLYIHSDGTLTDADLSLLKRFFPNAKFINPKTVIEDNKKKFEEHPIIKKFREKHEDSFFVTQLIDPYMVSQSRNVLFFDVDILWFADSRVIREAVEHGCPNSYLMDAGRVYDSCRLENTVTFKDGSVLNPLYSRFNSGIVLFNKKNFNLERLSDFVDRIDMMRPESRHWVEQSGYAYSLENLKTFPISKYIIKGEVKDGTVVKHYTGPRRVEFFAKGIPILMNLTSDIT